MRLLILTQKIDKSDDVLGFMHGWIAEFAKNCEGIVAICLERGSYDLPSNVKVLSLGKETGRSRLKYFLKFFKYIWQERASYDAVFVHMNPEYVVLGGLFWKALGKKISLWYAHGYVPWSLLISERLTDVIFTSTKSGCRINSSKIRIIGQGIDTDRFKPTSPVAIASEAKQSLFRIVTIGRISPSKDYETLISAAEILRDRGLNFSIDIIGGLGTADQDWYLQSLKDTLKTKNLSKEIKFLGPVSNDKILPHLHTADLFVNMGHTGSLDKAVLEAMSAGLPILTCNEAFSEVLGVHAKNLMFPKKDYVRLAEKIREVADLTPDERSKLGAELRNIISEGHSLRSFVARILVILKK